MSDQTPQIPKFPTMLRKMWSGAEVQQWIDENIAPLLEATPAFTGAEPVGWLVDWPDDPELGFYFSEEQNELARSRPLYLHPSPADEAVKLFINKVEKIAMSMKAPNIYTPQLMEACVAMNAAIAQRGEV